ASFNITVALAGEYNISSDIFTPYTVLGVPQLYKENPVSPFLPTASGDNSVAVGFGNTASGSYSFAEGAVTVASGDVSHAEGIDTLASGQFSHAEGVGTKAEAYNL